MAVLRRLLRLVPGASLILLMVATGVVIGAYISSRPIANLLATKAFVHSPVPGDFELPHTPYAISYSGDDIQIIGGQGGGLNCSIDPNIEDLIFERSQSSFLDFRRTRDGFVKPSYATAKTYIRSGTKKYAVVVPTDSVATQMRQACTFHDYCYRHGSATYGYSQSDCDYILLNHAYRLCRYIGKNTLHENCVTKAREVVLGVRVGGDTSFKRADDETLPPADGVVKKGETSKARLFDVDTTSTYFEFDPYPVRSAQYFAYRVADAPGAWRRESGFAKAIYSFDIKPSGTRLRIESWRAGTIESGKEPNCAMFVHLSASHGYLTTAPQIVRTRNEDGSMSDWFVWWRRRNLNQTGGHLSLLRPATATAEDWQKVFPSAYFTMLGSCKNPFIEADDTEDVIADVDVVGSVPQSSAEPDGHPLRKNAAVAPDVIERTKTPVAATNVFVGPKVKLRDDPLVPGFLPAPGLEPDRGLRLMALRGDSCVSKGSPLCYVDVLLDPQDLPDKTYDGKPFVRQEPRSVRDSYNHGPSSKRRIETLRYRNFVVPPILIGTPQDPVISWLTRGTNNDIGHADTALLRRARNSGSGSVGAGIVKLEGLRETMEPIFVASRTSKNPRLVSIYRDGSGHSARVKLNFWRLPEPKKQAKIDVSSDCDKEYDPQTEATALERCQFKHELELAQRLRDEGLVRCFKHNKNTYNANCLATAIYPENVDGTSCDLEDLEPSWLTRPPVALALRDGREPGALPVAGDDAIEPSSKKTTYDTAVLFSRLIAGRDADDTEKVTDIRLETKWMLLKQDGQCKLSRNVRYRIDVPIPRKSSSGDKDVKWEAYYPSKFLAILRSTPVLADYIDDNNKPDLVLPFVGRNYKPAPKSKLYKIPSLLFSDAIDLRALQ